MRSRQTSTAPPRLPGLPCESESGEPGVATITASVQVQYVGVRAPPYKQYSHSKPLYVNSITNLT